MIIYNIYCRVNEVTRHEFPRCYIIHNSQPLIKKTRFHIVIQRIVNSWKLNKNKKRIFFSKNCLKKCTPKKITLFHQKLPRLSFIGSKRLRWRYHLFAVSI